MHCLIPSILKWLIWKYLHIVYNVIEQYQDLNKYRVNIQYDLLRPILKTSVHRTIICSPEYWRPVEQLAENYFTISPEISIKIVKKLSAAEDLQ